MHAKSGRDYKSSVQLLGFRHFYWVNSMQGDTWFGASTTSPPSTAKSISNPVKTPSPLFQSIQVVFTATFTQH